MESSFYRKEGMAVGGEEILQTNNVLCGYIVYIGKQNKNMIKQDLLFPPPFKFLFRKG